jgi:acetylornithine deacetylase
VIRELHVLEEELNADPPSPYDTVSHPLNFNVGVVAGGDWPSTVAAECSLSCRIAAYPGAPIDELRRHVERAVARAAAETAVVRYSGFANEGTSVADEEPIVRAIASAWEAVAGEPAVTGPTTATTDVRAFLGEGIPAACIGPLAERIHGVDERVYVPSVVQTAQVLALLVRDWCGLA